MCRDRNDSDAVDRRREGADALRRLHSVEKRHLHVHQHDVIGAGAYGFDRLLAVLDNIHLMPDVAQHHRRQLLIDLVVLGDEHVQRSRRSLLDPEDYRCRARRRGCGAK